MSIPNSPLFTASFWIRYQDGSILNNANTPFYVFQPTKPGFAITATLAQQSWNFSYDIGVIFADGTGASLAPQYSMSTRDGVIAPNATGHHIFISADTGHPAGFKICNILIDGENVTTTSTFNAGTGNNFIVDLSPAFNIAFFPTPPLTKVSFGVPDTATFPNTFLTNVNVHYTEVWIACGQYLDPSQVSKFRDPVTGLPVPLGAHGELPTGVQPTYYLTGGPTDFINNRSSGPVTSSVGTIVQGSFNTFIDQNPATVFIAGDGYGGIFQEPCTAADSPFITISMWVRVSTDPNLLNFPNLVSVGLNSGAGSGGNSVLLGGNTSGNQADVGCFFASSTNPSVNQVAFSSGGAVFTPNTTGHHIFVSIDTNHAAGAKLLNIYIDGVNVKDNAQTLDTGPAFSMGFKSQASGQGNFGLPDISEFAGFVGSDLDYAEVWIACGQYVDPSNINKFRDPGTGLPVNLGQQGETPTGTSPTYYFKGPSDQFYQNLGTGGAVNQVDLSNSSIPNYIAIAPIGNSTWNLSAVTYPYPVPILDLDFTTATYKVRGVITPIASIITNTTQVRNNRLEVGIDVNSPKAPAMIETTTIAYINGTGVFGPGSPTTGTGQGFGNFNSQFTMYVEAQNIGPGTHFTPFDVFEWYSGAEISFEINGGPGGTFVFDDNFTTNRTADDLVQATQAGTPRYKAAFTRTNSKLHMALNGIMYTDNPPDFNGDQQDYWLQLPDPRLTEIFPPDPPGTLNPMSTFNNFHLGGFATVSGGGAEFNTPGDPDGGIYIFKFRIYPALNDRQLIALTT